MQPITISAAAGEKHAWYLMHVCHHDWKPVVVSEMFFLLPACEPTHWGYKVLILIWIILQRANLRSVVTHALTCLWSARCYSSGVRLDQLTTCDHTRSSYVWLICREKVSEAGLKLDLRLASRQRATHPQASAKTRKVRRVRGWLMKHLVTSLFLSFCWLKLGYCFTGVAGVCFKSNCCVLQGDKKGGNLKSVVRFSNRVQPADISKIIWHKIQWLKKRKIYLVRYWQWWWSEFAMALQFMLIIWLFICLIAAKLPLLPQLHCYAVQVYKWKEYLSSVYRDCYESVHHKCLDIITQESFFHLKSKFYLLDSLVTNHIFDLWNFSHSGAKTKPMAGNLQGKNGWSVTKRQKRIPLLTLTRKKAFGTFFFYQVLLLLRPSLSPEANCIHAQIL